MSEAEFNVDDAEAEYNAARGGDAPPGHPEADPKQHDTFDGDEPAKGHQSYEEYIEGGGDPDRYKGKQAFEDERERIAENKKLRGEVKSLKGTVQQTADAVGSLVEQARADTRKELEADLAAAVDVDDTAAALAAQKELDTHDAEAAAAAPAARPDEPEVISDFRAANPMMDPESETFDVNFADDVAFAYNDLAKRLSRNGARRLSDAEINRLLTRAEAETRDLHGLEASTTPAPKDGADGEPERSPRNDRRAATTAARRPAAQREADVKAEDFKIENPRNNRDHDAGSVRDMIRDTAYKAAKKAGKSDEDATKEAAAEAKKFERSLVQ